MDIGRRMDARIDHRPLAPADEPLPELAASADITRSPCGAGHLVVRAWGQGRPLALLHGGSGSWRHWARNIAFFAATHRVLVPDLPGLGDSDSPPDDHTAESLGQIVAEGLRAALPDGETYDLCGFSFGAMVASQVAIADPARLRSLTIVGAGAMGFPRHGTPLMKVRHLEGEERVAAHRANLARLMVADPASVDALALAIQEVCTRASRMKSPKFAATTALIDAVAAFPGPLNGIWGERDVTAHPTLQARHERLLSVRPDIDFRVIPKAGHWVQYEAADAFNAMLADMIAD